MCLDLFPIDISSLIANVQVTTISKPTISIQSNVIAVNTNPLFAISEHHEEKSVLLHRDESKFEYH